VSFESTLEAVSVMIIRVVKTGGPTLNGLGRLGFRLYRVGLRSLGVIWAWNLM